VGIPHQVSQNHLNLDHRASHIGFVQTNEMSVQRISLGRSAIQDTTQ